MIKKLFKKIRGILVIVLIGVVVFLSFNYIQYKKQTNDELQREANAKIEEELQQELFKKQIDKAEDYVESINNDVALTILRTKGNIKLSHDKTPANNKWTEWLFNSDIVVYADYTTAFTIETKQISMTVGDDATVIVTYDPDDITLSSIDVTNFTASDHKSIFGSNYTPEQVAALENLARERVLANTNSENNLKQAQINLETYLLELANALGVQVKIEAK